MGKEGVHGLGGRRELVAKFLFDQIHEWVFLSIWSAWKNGGG